MRFFSKCIKERIIDSSCLSYRPQVSSPNLVSDGFKINLILARETSRLPYFLINQLTDGCEVVSLTRRPPFTPNKDSWYSFLLEAK
jgi:hypothetical protein